MFTYLLLICSNIYFFSLIGINFIIKTPKSSDNIGCSGDLADILDPIRQAEGTFEIINSMTRIIQIINSILRKTQP